MGHTSSGIGWTVPALILTHTLHSPEQVHTWAEPSFLWQFFPHFRETGSIPSFLCGENSAKGRLFNRKTGPISVQVQWRCFWVLFILSRDSESLANKPTLGITTGWLDHFGHWEDLPSGEFSSYTRNTGGRLSSHILPYKPKRGTEILSSLSENFCYFYCSDKENSYFPRKG